MATLTIPERPSPEAFTRVALVGFGGPVTHRRILHTAWGEDRGASARARVQLTGEPEDSSYHCCRCHGARCILRLAETQTRISVCTSRSRDETAR